MVVLLSIRNNVTIIMISCISVISCIRSGITIIIVCFIIIIVIIISSSSIGIDSVSCLLCLYVVVIVCCSG